MRMRWALTWPSKGRSAALTKAELKARWLQSFRAVSAVEACSNFASDFRCWSGEAVIVEELFSG